MPADFYHRRHFPVEILPPLRNPCSRNEPVSTQVTHELTPNSPRIDYNRGFLANPFHHRHGRGARKS
jgi:hypothetical protein